MKRLSLLAILPVAASAIAATAQTAPTAIPSPKVAVIMFQAAVTQTNEFQRDVADLQKKYAPQRTQLQNLNSEIDSLTKQLQADNAKLTDAERASRSRVIEEKKKQLDRDTQDAQSDFQADMQQIIGSLAQKVGEFMTSYAQKSGYTLVLDAGNQQDQAVLYALPKTDITRAVIDGYNLKSGVPAPAPQAGDQPDAPQPQLHPQAQPAH